MASQEQELLKLCDVMISSTSKDLSQHRQKAMRAIHSAGMRPLGMEYDLAPLGDAISASYEMVDDAEIFVLLVGFRYGFIPDDLTRNPDQVSITELEYRRAVERKLPILVFHMTDEYLKAQPIGDSEKLEQPNRKSQKKLKTFKDHLMKERIVVSFGDPIDLQISLIEALHDPKVRTEGLERVRARTEQRGQDAQAEVKNIRKQPLPAPPALYALPPYILTDTFIGRKDELRALDAWAASNNPLLVIEAIGGVGKSALTWQWTNDRAVQFDATFWYSFYEGGATMSGFLRHALAYLEDGDADAPDYRSLRVDAQTITRLVTALKTRRCLLVMDGLERALVAYYRWDAAQMQDDAADDPSNPTDPHRDVRRCTDPHDGDLLQALTQIGASKVLITARLMPLDLEAHGVRLPGVALQLLKGMNPNDAVTLLQKRGVTVSNTGAAQDFLRQFDFHPLIVQIISGMILQHRRAQADFAQWLALEGHDLQISDLPIKARRENILARAYRDLSADAKLLLSQIAAFGDAVAYDTLTAFNPYADPAHPRQAVRQFDDLLEQLEDRGLLRWERATDLYDLHPVVRGYAYEQLAPDRREQTFDAIRGVYEALPQTDPDAAQTLDDLRPQLGIYRALLNAGKRDAAAVLYRRFGKTLYYSLAAYQMMLELLLPLFPDGIDQPPALTDAVDQSYFATALGSAFSGLGRTADALRVGAVPLRLDYEARAAAHCSVSLQNYAITLSYLKRRGAEARVYRLALALAAAADDDEAAAMTRLCLFSSAVRAGNDADAEDLVTAFTSAPPRERRTY